MTRLSALGRLDSGRNLAKLKRKRRVGCARFQCFAVGLLLLSAPLAFANPFFERPAYPDRDPYYTDEFDALKACATKAQPLYRYDYDRPEVAAAVQMADLLRHECGAEIEAVAKLTSPLEKFGGPQEMTGVLDKLIVDPLERVFEWHKPLPRRPLGTSELTLMGRATYFEAPTPFTPDELVAVERFDAFDDADGFDSTRFVHSGTLGGWSYTYTDRAPNSGQGYGMLTGQLERNGLAVHVECPPYRCSIRSMDRLLSLEFSTLPRQIMMLCNPGAARFSTDTAPLRPAVPAGSPRGLARQGTLSVNGGPPLALPNGRSCKPIGQELFARIAQATHLSTTFVAEYDTRKVTVEGSPEFLAPAIALAERFQKLSFDDRALTQRVQDHAQLYRRALPYTLRDVLGELDTWDAAVTCVARAVKSHHGTALTAVDAVMSGPSCLSEITDLEADAASTKIEPFKPADPAKTAPVIAAARALLRDEVVSRLARGVAYAPRTHFAEGERATSVMGHAGFAAGPASGTFWRDFGYAFDGRRAWGVIPNSRFRAYDEKTPAPPPTMTILCDAVHTPACTLTVPTNDGRGAIVMRADGGWRGSKACLSYAGKQLEGWRVIEHLSDEESAIELDANGCPRGRADALAELLVNNKVGALVAPGTTPEPGAGQLLDLLPMEFALALKRFLLERVRE